MKRLPQTGFTLIELLISIAIIGILTAFGTFAFQNAFGKARDAQRRSDLKQLQIALHSYYSDYGKYPPTVGIPGCPAGAGAPKCGEAILYGPIADYIPGLVPKYIRRLPTDPNVNKINSLNVNCNMVNRAGYNYQSDGSEYKLSAMCSSENLPLGSATKDAMYDPANPNISWAVYTDGAKDWANY